MNFETYGQFKSFVRAFRGEIFVNVYDGFNHIPVRVSKKSLLNSFSGVSNNEPCNLQTYSPFGDDSIVVEVCG